MDFPKAAVIGLIGDAGVVSHDYMLDGLDISDRVRVQAEMEAKRRAGATVLVRSAEPTMLRSVADEIWWFEDGTVRLKGDPDEVLRAYQRHALKELSGLPEIPCALRRGDGRARLIAVDMLDAEGEPVSAVQSGRTARIRVRVRFDSQVEDPVIGIMIRTRIGIEVYGTNTELEKLKLGPCAAGEIRTLTFEFCCDLCPQFYTITAASHDPDGVWHDWMEDAIGFTVTDSRYTAGVANLRASVTYSRE
jgi:lipopolysaccharide transport system ATP-binding protein